MGTGQIRVFLLDDHEVVRRGLRDLLESEGDITVVGESGSAREGKILALIAEGFTNRQMGEWTYVAQKTVKNYVSSILSKLGLESQTQAAVLAAKLVR